MSDRKMTSVRRPSGLKADIGGNYDKLVYWLYERRNIARARVYADRLGVALQATRRVGTIFVEDCLSLMCEARRDLPNAIKHRTNEIQLISRLHELAKGADCADIVQSQYDTADLRDSYDILAMLEHEAGHVMTAVNTLYLSKALCESSRIRFKSAGLLRDWEAIASQSTSSKVPRIAAAARISIEKTVEKPKRGKRSKKQI